MNYINEINSFRRYTSSDPLPANVQALWFLLLHINNTCGWIEWFSTSNSRLSNELCISEKTLRNIRNILIEKGFIIYVSQRRKKNSGQYKLHSISNLLDGDGTKTTGNLNVDSQTIGETTGNLNVDSQTTGETTVDLNVDGVKPDKTTFKFPDINKHCCLNNKTTTIEPKDLERVVVFFNQNIRAITPHEKKQILDWLDEFEYELIIHAIEISIENDKRNMKYINGILRNWSTKQLKTLKDVESDNKTFRNKIVELPRAKTKTNSFHDFGDKKSKYTNEEIEKKLGIRK